MSWTSKDGRVFPNRESRPGIAWTDWATWTEAPPAAFIFGYEEDGVPQGLWWKCWWGFIQVCDGVEVEPDPGWRHSKNHFAPFVPINGHPAWKWDGNRIAPTLSPSLLINDRYYGDPQRREVWHGWLQAGVFKSV